MPDATLSGVDFKKQLRAGQPKLGLFLNAHSPTVAEQLAHSGYDWLLVDTQHGPMGYEKLSAMLSGIANGGAKSMVRVGGYSDRPGFQQALDLGADGVLIPYINSAEEARQAVSCTKYPTAGTRSVYFPQRSMNKAGLLGYAGNANNNLIVALQVETADCIKNMAEIAAVPGVDILFLGQNDLCMSMGLYEKYEFPHMYTSPELGAATRKPPSLLLDALASRNSLEQTQLPAFQVQQFSLVRKAAPKTGQASVAADHAMARNDDWNGIAAIRKSHRAHRLGISNLLRQLPIRNGFAVRNGPQAVPHAELKLRSLRRQPQFKLS
jgi:4-hydroxy-2-oxoheptanedioate aldolase